MLLHYIQAAAEQPPLPDATVLPLPLGLDAWFGQHPLPGDLAVFAALLFVAWVSDVVARRLAHVAPALVIYFGLRVFQQPTGADVRVLAALNSDSKETHS